MVVFYHFIFFESRLDMLYSLKKQTFYTLKVVIGFMPLLLSMYLLYWLGKNEIWLPETEHRDKITIVVVATGMLLSFLIQSYFHKKKKK